MKTHNLPLKAAAYIKTHFPEAQLFHVRSHRDTQGHLYYDVQISQDDIIQRLKFDGHGDIIQQVEEEAFPENGFAVGD